MLIYNWSCTGSGGIYNTRKKMRRLQGAIGPAAYSLSAVDLRTSTSSKTWSFCLSQLVESSLSLPTTRQNLPSSELGCRTMLSVPSNGNS